MPPVEQARVEVFLELLDLEGDGRLRHVEVFRGTGKRAVLRYRVENLESAICHGMDKYDLFSRIKAQSRAFGGAAPDMAGHRSLLALKPLPYRRLQAP
ncbi:hypothetical protein MASR2M50_27790 [Thauera sp.]